jgi:hypothetical protein
VKIKIAENFILSAKAPTMRAGLMIMKVIWNMTNTLSGIVPDNGPLPSSVDEMWSRKSFELSQPISPCHESPVAMA